MNSGKYKWFTEEEIASWLPEHKKCRGCQEVLPFDKFSKNKRTLFGLDTKCRECRKPQSKKDWEKRTPEQNMLAAAKHRAKKYDVPFNLELADIVIPERCPVFLVPFARNDHNLCPQLDRIDPKKGYVKGNVAVISGKANRIKSDASAEELALVLRWLSERI